MIKKLVIKQNPESPVPAEIIAESIKAISDGIKKLRNSRLNDRALILLIQHACPSYGKYPKRYISAKDVQLVLAVIESLEAEYLKKPAKI